MDARGYHSCSLWCYHHTYHHWICHDVPHVMRTTKWMMMCFSSPRGRRKRDHAQLHKLICLKGTNRKGSICDNRSRPIHTWQDKALAYFVGRIIISKGKKTSLTLPSHHIGTHTHTHHFSCCCSFDLILLDPPFLPKAKKRKRIKRRPLRLSTPAFKSTNITHLNIIKVLHIFI